MVRVQVILEEQERELFRRLAERAGLSLSAWLRQAGREKSAALEKGGRVQTLEGLRTFFAECDAREVGREPEWEEHLAVISRSVASGESGT